MRFQRTGLPALLNGHDAACRFFSACFTAEKECPERLWVAHVDESARCLHIECYDGEPESVAMPVREIMADAARLGSVGVVIAHNHPSGDPHPSQADCRATRRLAAAAEAIDLTVLDHLIFGGESCTSMRRMGLL
jgi:DNA repair protein RadC